MCLFEPVNGSLAPHPFHQLTHTVPKRHPGFIAEQGPGEANVRVTVSDISLAELSKDAWPQVRVAERSRDRVCHLAHGGRVASAHVKRLIVRAIGLECQQIRLYDIGHMHEVATLRAVFEDDRRLAVQNPRTENPCD